MALMVFLMIDPYNMCSSCSASARLYIRMVCGDGCVYMLVVCCILWSIYVWHRSMDGASIDEEKGEKGGIDDWSADSIVMWSARSKVALDRKWFSRWMK